MGVRSEEWMGRLEDGISMEGRVSGVMSTRSEIRDFRSNLRGYGEICRDCLPRNSRMTMIGKL